MESLIDFLKARKCVTAEKVVGPNGAFIVAKDKKGNQIISLPVGKKSQEGKLADYNVLETEDGAFIATVNNYSTEETLAL